MPRAEVPVRVRSPTFSSGPGSERGVPKRPVLPTDVDLCMHQIAIEMGNGTSFNKAPVGVYFGKVEMRLTLRPGFDRGKVPVAVGRRTQSDFLMLPPTGMENPNVAPGPSFGSAQMRPWCLSMIERLTDSPIPMPPCLVV
jgi:hypothetical protein